MFNKTEEENDDLLRRKFNVIEYATPETSNRHKIDIEDIDLSKQIFHSYFRHSEKMKEYYNTNKNVNGKNTLSGYSGEVWSELFVMDIDSPNLSDALSITQNILRSIEANYEVDIRYIQVNFSGSKGFHIRIPAVLFGGFEPSPSLPQVHYKIAEELSDSIDLSIYRTTGLIRLVNSKNKKSGLFAIPLEANEIFTLSIDDITSLAKGPRTLERISDEELEATEELVALKEKHLVVASKPIVKKKANDNSSTRFEGVGEGERTTKLASIMGTYVSKGLTLDECIPLALAWNQNNLPPDSEDYIVSQVNSMYSNFNKNRGAFYTIDKEKVAKIDIVKYIDFLELNGFHKIYKFGSHAFIKSTDKIISKIDTPQIKDFVRKTVEEASHKEQVLGELISNNSKYFGDGFIEFLSPVDTKFVRDEKDKAFVFYKNGWLVVEGRGKTSLRPYSELDGFIWDNHVIDREFTEVEDYDSSDFSKYIKLIAGEDEERFNSFRSVIGYMMHTYKDASNAKAILLMDEKISDNPNGRTGKSLLAKALSKIRNSKRLDGKQLKLNGDDRFSFQEIELDHLIVDFNDIKRSFPFEQLFSIITDVFPVEKKRGRKFSIPFEESAKIILSTNYTLKGIGDSFSDRFFEIEIFPYFSAKRKPIDIFGRRFFNDWDKPEWNRFDNFMVMCISYFLENGLVKSETVNMKIRKLYNETSKDFVDFFEQNITLGEEYSLKKKFSEFYMQYQDYSSLKQNTFTKWIKNYCSIMEYEYKTRDSNGKKYITINSGKV